MTPIQKSQVILQIKSALFNPPILLAIGDGLNDVNMLRSADIGIGMINKNRYEAANNSDIAISNFNQLSRLILIHGRLS